MNEQVTLYHREGGGGGGAKGGDGGGVRGIFLGGIIWFSGGTKVGSVTTVNQQNQGHTTQRVNKTPNE